MLDLFFPREDHHGDCVVRFQKHADVDLPDPVLLEMHAALAKILHASGMPEHIDDVLRKREEIRCLATDGSTNVSRLLFAA